MEDFILEAIFQDEMVLQRDKPINIFGYSSAKNVVKIYLLNDIYEFTVDIGKFCLKLKSYEAVSKPFNITFEISNKTKVIKNCLIGDVYLFTGQSNMQYVCKDVKNVEYEDLSNLRLYEVPKLPYDKAEKEFDWLYTNDPKWLIANKENEMNFSAIAYTVSKEVHKKHNIPIGAISCNMGDTTIYSWLSKDYIESSSILKPYLDEYNSWESNYKNYEEYDNYFKKQVPVLMDFYGLLDKYRTEGFSSEEVYRKAYEKHPNPYLPMGPKNQNRPAGCYEQMLAKIIPYTNNGIVYYQGENDVSRPYEYKVAIKKLIDNWREAFDDELPFINCQIAGHHYSDTPGLSVAMLRDSQASMIDIKRKQYLVTAVDQGEEYNIHPLDKSIVSMRIFNVIDEFIYNSNKNSLSPKLDDYKIINNKLIINSKYNNLDLVFEPKEKTGFIAYNKDGVKTELKDIEVESSNITININEDIFEIRYAYTGYPVTTVYTKNNLPFLPFRIVL